MKIEASKRLLAALADKQQAIAFLTELGFKGLRFKSEKEDLIKFFYTHYDKASVTKHLGNPKPAEKSIRYDFGKEGVIAIWEKNKTVVLRNSKRGTRLTPVPVHAPVPKSNEPKTGTENDDNHVPIVHITSELHAEYQMAQRDVKQRLHFMQALWRFFNRTKFGSEMDIPSIRMMKTVKGTSFRLRGFWRPSVREFAISPRLFNATQNFFVEVFLHEMCHQAVSEIDKHDGYKDEQGHGKEWQIWMRKVGLNPRRFDPNDNTTYMNTKEKQAIEQKQQRIQTAIEQLNEAGAKRVVPTTMLRCSFIWNGNLYEGFSVCPALVSRKKWAVIDFDEYEKNRHGTKVTWKIVNANSVFTSITKTIAMANIAHFEKYCQAIQNFYQRKRDERIDRAWSKKEYGY